MSASSAPFRELLLAFEHLYCKGLHPIEQPRKIAVIQIWELLHMEPKKLWVVAICVGILLILKPVGFAQEMTKKDVHGVSPQHFKYIVTTLGGAAAGAGLGFVLGGGEKTGKLALIGGGAASAWFLYTHPATLGRFHDWAMVGSGTTLGMGLGWTICNCDNGLVAGTLIGGGGTALWEALKNDSAANNAVNRTTDKTRTTTSKADDQTHQTAEKVENQ